MQLQLVLLAAVVLCSGSAVESATTAGNLASTLSIVGRLCLCPMNRLSQTKVDAFFACYDQAPGKDLFVACQNQIFGGPMNTVANVGTTCRNPLKLPSYSSCLKEKFTAAGIDMNSAVETLNACQSAVLKFN